jgi:hypothetical protein
MLHDVAFGVLSIILGTPDTSTLSDQDGTPIRQIIWACGCCAMGRFLDTLDFDACERHAEGLPLIRGASVDPLTGRLQP